jgi:hypothetical protein
MNKDRNIRARINEARNEIGKTYPLTRQRRQQIDALARKAVLSAKAEKPKAEVVAVPLAAE